MVGDDVLLGVRRRVRGCTRCPAYEACTQPVPFTRPTSGTCLVAVVGEAPGRMEDETGIPFVGPAGSLFKNLLHRQLKLPERLTAYMNTASCWPGSTSPPTTQAIDACRPHRLDQLAALEPRWVLLTGQVALHAMFPMYELRWVHGRALAWDAELIGRADHWAPGRVTFFSSYHPAAALRQRKYMDHLVDDLTRFVEMVRRGRPDWSEECAVCGDELEDYSPHGLALCGRHLDRFRRTQPSLFPVGPPTITTGSRGGRRRVG